MNEQSAAAWQPLEDMVPAELFRAEVRAWARRLQVEPKSVRLRQLKHKWANCSSGGHLTFSLDLLRQPASVRAEAIIHELLHLQVPNHGPLFRALLRAYLAEWGIERLPAPNQPAKGESS